MSSGRVAPHPEVSINRHPSDNLKSTTTEAYEDRAPSTEAYRSQQFMDVTDDFEGLPPYQAHVADYFTIVQDINRPLTSDSINTFDLPGRLSYLQTEQYTGTGDFILFQGEAMETDALGDVYFSDISSSQISCCSDVGMYNSTESSAASSASAYAEHQRLVSPESLHPDTDEPCDIIQPVNLSRLLHWLQSVSSPPDINVSSVNSPSEPDIVSQTHCVEKYADCRDKSH